MIYTAAELQELNSQIQAAKVANPTETAKVIALLRQRFPILPRQAALEALDTKIAAEVEALVNAEIIEGLE